MSTPIPAPSLAAVKKLCRQLDIVPQREAGQNFLVDPRVGQAVLAAAAVEPADTVLEIGPGFGWLTQELAQRAKQVVAVELEKRFIPWLTTQLPTNVEVIAGDILRTNLNEVLTDRGYVLVSFLPYSITAKVFRQFLTQLPRPKSLVMVIQKEVADRICAKAGKQSKLSVLVQRYSQPKLIATVEAEAFWPQPGVDSAIVRCDLVAGRDATADEAFWRLVRIGFSSRRKTLINNLINGYQVPRQTAHDWVSELGCKPEARPQELTLDQWDRLLLVTLGEKK